MAVLGTESYQDGYDASKLPLGKRYKGVGILYALFDESPTVRTYLADGDDATVIVDAGWAFRERAGLLTGDAAFEDFGVAPRDVLADVLSVFGDDDRLQWAELAERLAGRYPQRWDGVTGDVISAELRGPKYRIKPCQVKRGNANKWGCPAPGHRRQAAPGGGQRMTGRQPHGVPRRCHHHPAALPATAQVSTVAPSQPGSAVSRFCWSATVASALPPGGWTLP